MDIGIDRIREIIKIGRALWEEHLVTSHGGNISVREKDLVYITNTGTKLGFLKEDDISAIPIDAEKSAYPQISSEWDIHRNIYLNTKAQAIIHAHPTFTVALSLRLNRISAMDYEGALTFKSAKVIDNHNDRDLLIKSIVDVLRVDRIVVVKGHGTFAIGKNLEEALFLTSSLEFSSKVILLINQWK